MFDYVHKNLSRSSKYTPMKRLVGFTLILTLLSTNAVSQETAVEKQFRRYVKLLNDLNETKDDNALIDLFAPDFKSLITTTALSGKNNTVTGNLDRQKKLFRKIRAYETIDINLKILELSNINQNEGKGSLTAKLSSVLYIDGKEHEKNSYIIDATIKKNDNGNWKFDYFYVDRTLEERKRGICVAYFYERKENYIVELNYPAVSDYMKAYYPFRFEFIDGSRKIIETDHDYFWKADNSVIFEIDEKAIEGTAESKKEAVGLILQNYYKDQCSEILLR